MISSGNCVARDVKITAVLHSNCVAIARAHLHITSYASDLKILARHCCVRPDAGVPPICVPHPLPDFLVTNRWYLDICCWSMKPLQRSSTSSDGLNVTSSCNTSSQLYSDSDSDECITPTSDELKGLEREVKRLSRQMGDAEVQRRSSDRVPCHVIPTPPQTSSSSQEWNDAPPSPLVDVSLDRDVKHKPTGAPKYKYHGAGESERCDLCVLS